MIPRIAELAIEERLFRGKVVLLYGARQTGKTTLVKDLLEKHGGTYFNADEPDVRLRFANRTSSELRNLVGTAKLVVIDEAQRIENIGLTLKLMVDNFPDVQVIATGSSSFELADRLKEPLTGRKHEFMLPPFSLEEMEKATGKLEVDRMLSKSVVYGMYPEPALFGVAEARERLLELGGSYLYKDILLLGQIRHPDALEKLLRALALQVGSEVSYTELAGLAGIDKNTVETYVRILEQAFIIFRLPPFSRNLRNELKKMRKIYFWDTGIRNAVINSFAPIEARSDAGALWENFLIAERMKYLKNHRAANQSWFWRTHQQQEIDYIEERESGLLAMEIKSQSGRGRIPATFSRAYPGAESRVIDPGHWRELVYADV
ncbi:MAG: ATPase [Verrucomicrobia bacterium]|nr:MAG: ATPase [Verrucomicrobiota bacterium]